VGQAENSGCAGGSLPTSYPSCALLQLHTTCPHPHPWQALRALSKHADLPVFILPCPTTTPHSCPSLTAPLKRKTTTPLPAYSYTACYAAIWWAGANSHAPGATYTWPTFHH